MPDLFKLLSSWSPTDYQSASIRGQGNTYMVPPSVNALLSGSGFIRVSRGPKLLNGKLGSQLFFLADTQYCGLGDASATASGSTLSARQLLIFVGSGQVNFAGAKIIGAVATSTPSYIKKVGGVYLAANMYQVGHAQPSAPLITAKDIPSVNQTPMSAAVSVVVWRISKADNQPSLMSLPSNVLVLSAQSVILQFPAADLNGQTDWGIGVPKPGLADLGVFYQLPTSLHGIVSEAALAYTRSLGTASAIVEVITDATNAGPIVITSAAHHRVTGDTVVIAGVTGNTAANGSWVVTKIDANTYSLNGSVGNGAYVSGGTAGTNIVQASRGLTNATNATPIVITDNGHPFITGAQVIVTGVVGNTAANGTWTITKIDANTYSLNGSVGNGAYTSGGTVGSFTGVDVGRRVAIGAFDSYIVSIDSPTQIRTTDINTTGATISAAGTITHAVDGITRAIEISWTAGALLGQDIAPDKAFPPFASQFMGAMNDVFFVESDGIIYVSEPGFLGSYPASNALFPNEPGVRYLRITDGLIARFGKTSFGVLTYVGGSPALEWHELWHNQGILYPQNVAIGARGRLMIWMGKPVIVENGITPDDDYALNVLPDFEGWDTEQTAETPISPGYDPVGKFECWFLKKKANVLHVPSKGWCSPQDFTGQIVGDIIHAVTFQQKLYFATSDGIDMRLYQFDAGSGSTMLVQFDDTVEKLGEKISEVYVRGRVDNDENPVRVEIVKNFTDDNTADVNPILVSNETPAEAGYYALRTRKKQIFNVKTHAVRVTMTSQGGDAGLDVAQTRGSSSETILARQT